MKPTRHVFFFDNGASDQRYEAPTAPRTFGVTANLAGKQLANYPSEGRAPTAIR